MHGGVGSCDHVDGGDGLSARQADRIGLPGRDCVWLGPQLAGHEVPARAMPSPHRTWHRRLGGGFGAGWDRAGPRRDADGAAQASVAACGIRIAQRQRLDGAYDFVAALAERG